MSNLVQNPGATVGRGAAAAGSGPFFDLAVAGMAVTDGDGVFLRVNPALARIAGAPADVLVGTRYGALWPTDDGPGAEGGMAGLARVAARAGGLERRSRRADGTVAWAKLSISPLTRVPPSQARYLVQAEDITSLKVAEEEAQHHKDQLGRAEHLVKLGSFQQRLDSETFTASDGLHQILGVPAGTQVDVATLMAIVHPEDRQRLGEAMRSCVQGGQGVDMVHRLVPSGGTTRWVRVQAGQAVDEHGLAVVVGTVWDVTDVKLTEEALEIQRNYDPLTGLPNRSKTAALLAAMLEDVGAPGPVTVIMADVDRFKTVKDSLGHSAGDTLLRKLAYRLRQEVRPSDVVGQFFGDEFVILCPGLSPPEAYAAAKNIADAVERPLLVEGVSLRMTASVGYARVSPADKPEGAFRDAEAAMFRAKRHGRGQIEAFNSMAREEASRRLHTEVALREALVRGELAVHYQPIVDLVTSQVVGVEALARWECPERGLVPPDEFIPIAEETGLINELGARVLRQVCEDQPLLLGAGHAPLTAAVNLSAHQLCDPALLAHVQEILAATSADPRYLVAEVTETAIMHDPESALTALQGLRDMGMRVALDDFGTGYSSLAYLKRYPIDIVKVDRSFVAGLGRDANDALITSAIVNLAYTLDLAVVAEGVETTAQLEELRHMGCRGGQGFLWSGAVPLARLADVVAARPVPLVRAPAEAQRPSRPAGAQRPSRPAGVPSEVPDSARPSPPVDGGPDAVIVPVLCAPSGAAAPDAAGRRRRWERSARTAAGKLRPQVLPGTSDLEVSRSFWRRQMHIGFAVGLVVSLSTCGYLLATPGRPHRAVLWAVLAPSVPASVVLYWRPGLALVKRSLVMPFSLAWSLAMVAVMTLEAWLDGGVSSPIVCLLVIPVLFAGLAYPPSAVAAVGVLADACYAGLALVSGKKPADTVVFGFGLLVTGVLMVVGAWARRAQDQRLYEMATSDGLTGCLTHRAFGERLEAEVARAERFGRPLALLMADLDHLKQMNDTQGHAAGDRALSAVGRALLGAARELDIVGRLGGDEFAMLLPETDEARARLVLERVRATLRAALPAGVGLSFGCAALRRRDTPQALLGRADRSLYEAKGNRPGPGRAALSRRPSSRRWASRASGASVGG